MYFRWEIILYFYTSVSGIISVVLLYWSGNRGVVYPWEGSLPSLYSFGYRIPGRKTQSDYMDFLIELWAMPWNTRQHNVQSLIYLHNIWFWSTSYLWSDKLSVWVYGSHNLHSNCWDLHNQEDILLPSDSSKSLVLRYLCHNLPSTFIPNEAVED